MLLVKGEHQRSVVPEAGVTILQHAENNEVEWNSFCKRGTCARCRCEITEGIGLLSEPNEAEQARLDPEEIEEGYRLGCQTTVTESGDITIKHAPYF
ncbi:(2Fe-2S)-binding protein [Paenibacillus lemnae]|uniref:(2Fe-2S)-binding protein n=1 Tax=Paenibacillus lemnae TaxID=1330551 RepID=A0A848MCC4_PAELE|nr:(2Fe-2S)-binding protein [Paenibacillus lemnae]